MTYFVDVASGVTSLNGAQPLNSKDGPKKLNVY